MFTVTMTNTAGNSSESISAKGRSEPQESLEGKSQFDAVHKDDSGVITTGDAVKIIVKDPLFSVLEEDPNVAHPPR